MSPALPPQLLALSPGTIVPPEFEDLLARARAAIASGLRGILLREPGLEDGPYLGLARSLAELLGAVDGWLGLHDRPHLVAATRRPGVEMGVHLGFRSLPPREARAVVGPDVAIGFSGHAGDAAQAWEGADYLFHGPVFDTPSKRGLHEPVGLAGLEEAVRERDLPIWGLGGIEPDKVRAILATGARGVAALRPILSSVDPAAACAGFLAHTDVPPAARS